MHITRKRGGTQVDQTRRIPRGISTVPVVQIYLVPKRIGWAGQIFGELRNATRIIHDPEEGYTSIVGYNVSNVGKISRQLKKQRYHLNGADNRDRSQGFVKSGLQSKNK